MAWLGRSNVHVRFPSADTTILPTIEPEAASTLGANVGGGLSCPVVSSDNPLPHRAAFCILAAVAFGYLAGCEPLEAFLSGTGVLDNPRVTGALDLLKTIPPILIAGAAVIYLAISSLQRGIGRAEGARSKGYRMGYFFATADLAFGVLVGALLAVLLGLGSWKELTTRVPSWPHLVANGLVGLMAGAAALVRRYPACYFAIVTTLTANALLYVVGAISWFYLGKVLTAAYCAAIAAVNCGWIAYFRNRRHMFGYLREEPMSQQPLSRSLAKSRSAEETAAHAVEAVASSVLVSPDEAEEAGPTLDEIIAEMARRVAAMSDAELEDMAAHAECINGAPEHDSFEGMAIEELRRRRAKRQSENPDSDPPASLPPRQTRPLQ